jgi:hypothetical protein
VGETDTTIDIVAIAIVALVIGFIVYEVSQAASSISQSTGGWFGVGAAFVAGILLF